ncbi:hypothetical protein [Croceicoccus sp. Ery15]|uniref:hypothetical protein n=1 Tax=Croceicoccus sp. Ery15 TaxID=1703338 RepID=UPI001E2BC6D8|nr:hypothetical protein [Croceicoccus sp. Ery15]
MSFYEPLNTAHAVPVTRTASDTEPDYQAPRSEMAEPVLNRLERRVIDIVRKDSLKTLKPRRERGRLARILLGPEPVSPSFANPRLEAIRHVAVYGWQQGIALPARALGEARAAGLTRSEIDAILDIIRLDNAGIRKTAP